MAVVSSNPLPDDFVAIVQWLNALSPKTATQMTDLLQQTWAAANHGHLPKWQSALSELQKLPCPTDIEMGSANHQFNDCWSL